ncbi:hypothetical protein HY933_02475 [Candidatus Falkowbacteria bacterium]|nr:hypothetical protein [Candidatus Falkowbacteria bacterium]
MDDEMKKMLIDYLAKTDAMSADIKKIKRYILIDQIMSVLKIFLILIPLIVAIIYLPPFLRTALEQVQSLYNLGGSGDLSF